MKSQWKVTPAGQNQTHPEGDSMFPSILQVHQEGKSSSVHFGFPSADVKLKAQTRVISTQTNRQDSEDKPGCRHTGCLARPGPHHFNRSLQSTCQSPPCTKKGYTELPNSIQWRDCLFQNWLHPRRNLSLGKWGNKQKQQELLCRGHCVSFFS